MIAIKLFDIFFIFFNEVCILSGSSPFLILLSILKHILSTFVNVFSNERASPSFILRF